MSCKNQSGAGLMKKLFKRKPKKPTATQLAKAIKKLDYKKVNELIKKGADVNAKYLGRKPLQLLGDTDVDKFGLNFTKVMESLINNGSVINDYTIDEWKDMAKYRKDLIKNTVFSSRSRNLIYDDEDIHDQQDIDSLEAYEVLIEFYKKEQQKRKKAVKKGIKGKKGFELGIGDIIGEMVAGAAQKKKKSVCREAPGCSRGIKADRRLTSKQRWERGRGAKKKANPRYMPKMITDKNGIKRKVYVLRNPNHRKN